MKRQTWIANYVNSRVTTPATPIMQNLLHARASEKIANESDPKARKAMEMNLRSRRAQSGMKCPNCGLVGYYRVNCPKCAEVKIDIMKDDWRPVTPEEERRRREREEMNNSPEKQVSWARDKSDPGGATLINPPIARKR